VTSHKALIISFYFPPANTPATVHADWFFSFVPEHGVATSAIASSVYFPMKVDREAPSDDIIRVPITRTEGFWRRLYREELRIQGKCGVWEPGFLWSELAFRAASRRHRRERFTAMVSVSPPVTSHWAAYRLKRRFPYLKWIADFQDPLLGNPFRLGGPTVRSLERRLERAIFVNADCVSANTDTVQAMWQERYPELRDKFIVSWGGYDPRETIAARPLPERCKPVISHVGVMYQQRVPNLLFDSLGRLRKRGKLGDSDLVVELVGSGDLTGVNNREQFEWLQTEGIVSVRSDHISRAKALATSAEADYLLLLDLSGTHHTKLQVPSKLFDYVRIGRPILAFTPHDSPTERILTRSGAPCVVIHSEAPPEEVDAGILRLLTLPRTPQPPSPWFLQTFDARQLVKPVADLIRA